MRLLFCLSIFLPVLTSGPANAKVDPYASGRALVADIGRVVTPNGVRETLEVTLGGARQVVNVSGADKNNPILLFIHGGPGAVEMPIAWTFQRQWEDYSTVVQWDQRGAGRSYRLNDPVKLASTLTPERYRDDAIELIEQPRLRYAKRKIIVLGHSWGSLVGLMVAAKRPDLLYAYVGMGQLIDFRKNERAGMDWTMSEARKRGDDAAYKDVKALAPYPESGAFRVEAADGWRQHAIRYDAIAAGRSHANFYQRAPRLSPEYNSVDLKAWEDGSLYTVKTISLAWQMRRSSMSVSSTFPSSCSWAVMIT
jgi:proline iminopeptidase